MPAWDRRRRRIGEKRSERKRRKDRIQRKGIGDQSDGSRDLCLLLSLCAHPLNLRASVSTSSATA
jgi:hypothetical protein